MGSEELEKYRLLVTYHASERQIFVARSQIFVFSSSALIAFATRYLPQIGSSASWSDIATSGIAVVLGLGLWVGWRRAINAGNWWIHRFRNALVPYEKSALGDTKVFRDVKKDEPDENRDGNDKAGDIWRFLLRFFLILWLSLAGWVVVSAIVKLIAVQQNPVVPIVNFDRVAICALIALLIATLVWHSRMIHKNRAVLNAMANSHTSENHDEKANV